MKSNAIVMEETTKTKKAWTHLKAFEVLVYLATIREPTPRSWANLLIFSLLQKLPVFKSEIKVQLYIFNCALSTAIFLHTTLIIVTMDNVNRRICKYIYYNWIINSDSQRKFADEHNIEESIVRKIKKASQDKDYIEYNIPITTLEKICTSREIKLYEFFKMVNI